MTKISNQPLPFVLENLPNDDYHADEGDSSSQLVTYVAESSRHYRVAHPKNPDRKPQEETDPMRLGSDMHCYLLERDQFHLRYLVLPADTNLRTNAGKALRDEMKAQAEARGGSLLKAEEMTDVVEMASALGETEVKLGGKMYRMADLFKYGKPEVSFFWKDVISGRRCRCRVDWLIQIPGVLNLIIDYKTTRSAKRGRFQPDAGSRYYWMRQAFYIDGVKANTGIHFDYLIVAQEKNGPKLAQAFNYEPHYEAAGRELYRQTLLDINECEKENRWPGYPPEVQYLDVPGYILYDHPGLAEIADGRIVPTHIHEGD